MSSLWNIFSTISIHFQLLFLNRRKIFDDASLPKYLNKVTDPTFNSAIVQSLSKVSYEIQHNHRQLIVCKEIILTLPIVFFYPKNHFLVQTMNGKIDLFSSAGLIDFMVSKYIDKKYIKDHLEPDHHPKQLNIQQLLGGFQIWIACCLIGSIIFFIELFWRKIAF